MPRPGALTWLVVGAFLFAGLFGGGFPVWILSVFGLVGAALVRRARPYPGGRSCPAKVVEYAQQGFSSKGQPMTAEVLEYQDPSGRWQRLTDSVSSTGRAPVGSSRVVSFPPDGVPGEPRVVRDAHFLLGLVFCAPVLMAVFLVDHFGAQVAFLAAFAFHLGVAFRGGVQPPVSRGGAFALALGGAAAAFWLVVLLPSDVSDLTDAFDSDAYAASQVLDSP